MVKINKIFRVFVSSTFNDFKEERDALQKKVFSELKEFCKEKGHDFQAVDLRWGVSEEAAINQQAMKICLEEIERSQKISPKPNFIVLLGNRYGWIPIPSQIPEVEFNKIKTQVNKKEKTLLKEWFKLDENTVPPVYDLLPRTGEYVNYDNWAKVEDELRNILQDAVDKLKEKGDISNERRDLYFASAVEQEVEKGKLSIDAKEHVFCFCRNITMDKNETINYNKQTGPFFDFIKIDDNNFKLNDKSFESVINLKNSLKKEKYNFKVYNTNFKQISKFSSFLSKIKNEDQEFIEYDYMDIFCKDVYNSLKGIIKEQMKDDERNPLDVEIKAHQDFAKEKSEDFVGRKDILYEIEKHVFSDNDQPLAICGNSGTGKTALLSQSSEDLKEKYPHLKIISRFIGVTPKSSDITSLLYGICQQLAKNYNQDIKMVPKKYLDLLDKFFELMTFATKEEPLVIFLDGLNQLSDFEDARELGWLPTYLPKNVHMVVSTVSKKLKMDIREILEKENIKILKAMPLTEGKNLLELWLENANRTLTEEQENEILKNFKKNGLPLFLKLAFQESMTWKSYTPIVELPDSLQELISNIFDRLSNKSNHSHILVSKTLSYLTCSRYGLSEEEIYTLISTDREIMEDYEELASDDSPKVDKLPFIIYSRLYSDLKPFLTEKNLNKKLLLNFHHQHFIETTQNKYLIDSKEKKFRSNLINLFKNKTNPDRTAQELPWHLMKMGRWDELYEYLNDFDKLEKINDSDLKYYWSKLTELTDYKIEIAYSDIIENPEKYPKIISKIAFFLHNTSYYNEASKIYDYLINLFEKHQYVDGLNLLLILQGDMLAQQGKLNKAMEFYKKSVNECIRRRDDYGVSLAQFSQAHIYEIWGEIDKAISIAENHEKLSSKMKNKFGIIESLLFQAKIIENQGKLEEALKLYKLSENLCRQINQKAYLYDSLLSQSTIFMTWGQVHESLEIQEKMEELSKNISYNSGSIRSLGDKALSYQFLGKFEKALETLKIAEKLCRKIHVKIELEQILGNQANILMECGKLEKAMELHQEEEQICRKLNFQSDLSISLGNQAIILRKWGQKDKSLELHQEEEMIARELKNKKSIMRSLINQNNIFRELGRLNEAKKKLKEAKSIAKELNDRKGLLYAYLGLAIILQYENRHYEAMAILEDQEAICRKLRFEAELQHFIGEQAVILMEHDILDVAMDKLIEQEEICERLNIKDSLQIALGNQAAILANKGLFEDSLIKLRRKQEICESCGYYEELLISLDKQILTCMLLGDDDAIKRINDKKNKIVDSWNDNI
ncbi:MAG: DUF4062 domain-containing protein [Methanobrevibacter sp.]|nr:DUF4062 domain-containing protein [Methanobrevibacter sp.]